MRGAIGHTPPDGWPLRRVMLTISVVAVLGTMWQTHRKICSIKNTHKLDCGSHVYLSNKNKKETNLRSEVFDGDSDTIIEDNSATCIIWKHKKKFIPETYVQIENNSKLGVSSAVGSGVPIAIDDLNIGWRDDTGRLNSARRGTRQN